MEVRKIHFKSFSLFLWFINVNLTLENFIDETGFVRFVDAGLSSEFGLSSKNESSISEVSLR